MVKHQFHENFKTFVGTSLVEVSALVSNFVTQSGVAVKSLSVVQKRGEETFETFVCIGFRNDVQGYPVTIVSAVLGPTWSRPSDIQDLDTNLVNAEKNMEGNVICHSLFINYKKQFEVAFLLCQ